MHLLPTRSIKKEHTFANFIQFQNRIPPVVISLYGNKPQQTAEDQRPPQHPPQKPPGRRCQCRPVSPRPR